MKIQLWTKMSRFAAIGASLLMVLILSATAFGQNSSTSSANVKIKWVPITYVSPSDGPAMYAQYCASCHGPMGKGDGPAAPALSTPPTDLTSLTARNNGSFPTRRVRIALSKFAEGGDEISLAKADATMPYWHQALSTENPAEAELRVHNLVLQVKKLQVAGDLAGKPNSGEIQ